MYELIFCTLPVVVEGERLVYGFTREARDLELSSFFLTESGELEGIAPLYYCDSIAAGLAHIDQIDAYLASQEGAA